MKLVCRLFVLLLLFTGCSDNARMFHDLDDVKGVRVAVRKGAVEKHSLDVTFPNVRFFECKGDMEIALSLFSGKSDVAVIDYESASRMLSKNMDLVALTDFGIHDGSLQVIALRERVPSKWIQAGKNEKARGYLERLGRSLVADGYWQLLLRGLSATVIIFFFGAVFAMALALLLTLWSISGKVSWLSKPVMWFVNTIHDVPSVVLIFFFYYVVFAGADVNGLIVCIIALSIYSCGTLSKLLKVHIGQIDPVQHKVAQMLGFAGWKKYRYIILPQAVKSVLPLAIGELKVLLRATTYAGYISQIDLVKAAEMIRTETYDALVPLLLVSLVFLFLSVMIEKTMNMLYIKLLAND